MSSSSGLNSPALNSQASNSSASASVFSKTYRIVSWNVNGIRAGIKKGFFDWLTAEQADIIGVQETKIAADQLTLEMISPQGYRTYWAHAEKRGYSGVALFSKEEPLSVAEGFGIAEWDTEGRVVVAEYPEFVLYNIYYPNGGRGDDRIQYKLDFYDVFLDHAEAKRKAGKKIVAIGDFNTAHHPIDLARPKDNETITGFLPIERAWLDKFTAMGYIDTFRHFYPEAKEMYSWWHMRTFARNRNVGWRIDYCFVSPELKENLVEAQIHTETQGSDHCPVSLTLGF
ncbi:MAG: exodeoxyribonuclease III [Cyanobacteria bacterium P01_H01_bin.74]